VLPQFDPATRTLKVRLEADNPGFLLRPDLFVDVEMPVELGPALTVPKEAVLDSGTRRVVYVAKGEGVFEPRKVETGFREGDRVEIVSGLAEGEKVVTSGNFLLDSESRMRAAGAEETPEGEVQAHAEAAHATMAAAGSDVAATAKDPICGMTVDTAEAKAAGRTSTYEGRTYYFCAPGCKEAFDKDPAAHAKPRS
jgi:YHS domain-containing protein